MFMVSREWQLCIRFIMPLTNAYTDAHALTFTEFPTHVYVQDDDDDDEADEDKHIYQLSHFHTFFIVSASYWEIYAFRW